MDFSFYPNNNFGWIDDQREVERIVSQLPFPIFADAAPHLADTGKGKDIFLWFAEKELTGKLLPPHKQTIGDCFVAGTLVTMADGSEKAIEDVQIGDSVITPFGNVKKVTDTIKKTYSGNLATMSVRGYSETITSTPDHQFLTYPNFPYGARSRRIRQDISYDLEYEPVVTLAIDQRVLIPYCNVPTLSEQVIDILDYFPQGYSILNDTKIAFDQCRHFPKRYIKVNSDLSWLIGIYLAEGGISYNECGEPTSIQFSLNRNEQLFAKQIKAIFIESFGINVSIVEPENRPNNMNVFCYSKAIAALFSKLIPGNIYSKAVPPVIWQSNELCRLACLRGWMDGDGSFEFEKRGDSKHYRLKLTGVSASKALRRNMFRLALSLGLKATLTQRKERADRHLAGDVHLYSDSALAIYPERRSEVLQKIRIDKAENNATKYGLALPVKSITLKRVSDIFVYCLEVEDDHSFVANGFGCSNCVSHGSSKAIDTLRFVRIAWQNQSAEDFIETASEAIYGGSRIEIGKGQCGYQDGSVGAWAAQWLLDYGIIHRMKYDSVDLSTYSGQLAKKWGNSGVPKDLETLSKEFPAKSVSLVNSWDDLRDAIGGAKCPLFVCSNQGFTTTRDSQGFCTPKGSWGHCFLPTALISGSDIKTIKDVQVGDQVYSHDGKLHFVTETIVNEYEGDVLTIKATGNIPITCTPEHPFLVYRRNQYKYLDRYSAIEPIWVKAESLCIGDCILSPMIDKPESINLPCWDVSSSKATNIPDPITQPSDNLAWMMGYYIANGNIKKGHGIEFTIPLHYSFIPERLVNTFNDFNLYPRIETKDNCFKVKLDSVIVERSFREWFGDYSYTKRVPHFLFTWTNHLDALLEGMYYGDGTSDKRESYTTVSPVLMRQLWHLQVTKQRHVCTTHASMKRVVYPNALPQYRIEYKNDPSRLWSKFVNNHYVMPIRAMTRNHYKGPVHNLEVADTHSYLADGIIAHNCTAFIGVSDNPKRPGAVYQQSWGPGMPDGPLHVTLPHGVDLDLPEGAFLVDAEIVDKMVRQGDSYVVSDIVGYPHRPDDDFVFKFY